MDGTNSFGNAGTRNTSGEVNLDAIKESHGILGPKGTIASWRQIMCMIWFYSSSLPSSTCLSNELFRAQQLVSEDGETGGYEEFDEIAIAENRYIFFHRCKK